MRRSFTDQRDISQSAKVRGTPVRWTGWCEFPLPSPSAPAPGSHSDLGQNKENSPRLSTLTFSTPITDNEPRTVCIVVTMKCEYPRALLRRHTIPVHATDNASHTVLKSGRVAIISRGRYAGKKVRNTSLFPDCRSTTNSPLAPKRSLSQKAEHKTERDDCSFAETISSPEFENPPDIVNHRSSSSKPKMPARKHTRSRTHW